MTWQPVSWLPSPPRRDAGPSWSRSQATPSRRGEPAHADVRRRNVAIAVDSIADLAADHDVVVTHGNGPRRA